MGDRFFACLTAVHVHLRTTVSSRVLSFIIACKEVIFLGFVEKRQQQEGDLDIFPSRNKSVIPTAWRISRLVKREI